MSRVGDSLFGKKETDPAPAYDQWSETYDQQPGNLILDLDEVIFSIFLEEIDVTGTTIVDIGCGTGRHWKRLLDKNPKQLTGFDISQGMLDKLKEKFPDARVFRSDGIGLAGMNNNAVDLVISTLTVAHIKNIEEALVEWNRVLKPGGGIIITDYHPDLLVKGAKRTFRYNNRTVIVKNYVHSIETLQRLARQLHWMELRFIRRIIDNSVKEYYERQNALSLFEKFMGTPVIYGIHLKKEHDPA